MVRKSHASGRIVYKSTGIIEGIFRWIGGIIIVAMALFFYIGILSIMRGIPLVPLAVITLVFLAVTASGVAVATIRSWLIFDLTKRTYETSWGFVTPHFRKFGSLDEFRIVTVTEEKRNRRRSSGTGNNRRTYTETYFAYPVRVVGPNMTLNICEETYHPFARREAEYLSHALNLPLDDQGCTGKIIQDIGNIAGRVLGGLFNRR